VTWRGTPDRFGRTRRPLPAVGFVFAEFAVALGVSLKSSGPSRSSSAAAGWALIPPRPVYPHPGEATTQK
jgi:hypothetical protein